MFLCNVVRDSLRTFLPTSLQIMKIGWPIVLSSTGFMLMQVVDGLFVSRYSSEAVAALGPSGMAVWLIGSFFMGTVGYVNTLVAHCYGAKVYKHMAVATWQAVYLALFFVLLIMCASPFLYRMFSIFGHTGEFCRMEETYFSIMLITVCLNLVGCGFSGFFIGRGDTKPIMVIQIGAQCINAILGYVMVLGHWGCPALGIAGAGWAAVVAAFFGTVSIIALFFRKTLREQYDTWSSYRFNMHYFRVLWNYGSHAGVRVGIESVFWTMFMMFVGRLGTVEAAASSIAVRLNLILLFPLFGLSEAVRTLVGHAKGGQDIDGVRRVTWVGLVLVQTCMMIGGICYVLFGEYLYSFFSPADPSQWEEYKLITATGVVLLRFVGAYCFADGMNILLTTALQGVGDTRWVMNATLISYGTFISILGFIGIFSPNLYWEWGAATVFVLLLGFLWLFRFLSGRWESVDILGACGKGEELIHAD